MKGFAPGMDICCELQKLPNLIDHYQTHNLTGEESFAQFVFNHYLDMGGSTHNHDEKEHDKLPFHGSHQCSNFSAFYTTAQHFQLNSWNFTPEESPEYYISFFSSQFPETLFQPPKV